MASDRVEHNIWVVQEGLISKPEDAKASVGEPGVSQTVTVRLDGVNAAVQFNDELELGAEEIDDGATQWRLSAKLEAVTASIAKLVPEYGLRAGHFATQAPGLSCLSRKLKHEVRQPPHPSGSAAHLLPRGEKGD